MARKLAITLGADPEFELVRDGRVVNASHVLKKSVRMPWGIIGYDGAGGPLELRPNPSTSPSVLVKNVGRLLLSVPMIAGGLPSTMGEMYAIGGHVHIGIRGLGVPYEDVVRTIDDAVGDILYQMNTRTRLNSSYGKRGDWRRQAWGLEYRTPPATMWAHPEGALAFLKAIRRAVRLAIEGRKYALDDDWYKIRYALSGAAILVMQHNGRIHWEAWKAYVGENEVKNALQIASAMNCEVRVATPLCGVSEHDEGLIGDIGTMLARLGIRKVAVVVFPKWRGDYASNVRGYGVMQYDHGPYEGEEGDWAQPLMLSWRFCNDPDFRRNELPKLEAAIASLVGLNGERNESRIVKEVIHLNADWPGGDDDDGEAVELEAVETNPHTLICTGCQEEFPNDEAIYTSDGGIYCEDCYHENYGTCVECESEVALEDAFYVYGNLYCEDCYYDRFTTCDACGEDIERDEAYAVGESTYCEPCYERRFVECDNCGNPVLRREVILADGERFCEECYLRVFVVCEMCEATIRRDEAHFLHGEAFCDGCYARAIEEEAEQVEARR